MMRFAIQWRFIRRLAILLAATVGFAVVTLKFVSKDEVRRQCRPRQNVVFIKTHKCASSTIQNILLRFGEAHNLTFVLPEKLNYLGFPGLFQRTMVPDAAAFNLTYNILTHHTRFNYQEMRLLMPEDTVYVTIVRHPVDLFESMYYYYKMNKFFSTVLEPSFTANASILKVLRAKRLLGKIGDNQMSFDLGLDPSDFDRPTVVRKFLGFLDLTMDFVMVAEQMDQSLVLLADLLCWKLDDVVTLRLNARHTKYKPRVAWPSRTRRELQSSLLAADATLYEYFVRRFRDRVRDFGDERMQRQTKELERLTIEKMVACGIESHAGNSKIPALKRVVYYTSGRSGDLDCARLVETGLKYTDRLRKKQQVMFLKKTNQSG